MSTGFLCPFCNAGGRQNVSAEKMDECGACGDYGAGDLHPGSGDSGEHGGSGRDGSCRKLSVYHGDPGYGEPAGQPVHTFRPSEENSLRCGNICPGHEGRLGGSRLRQVYRLCEERVHRPEKGVENQGQGDGNPVADSHPDPGRKRRRICDPAARKLRSRSSGPAGRAD